MARTMHLILLAGLLVLGLALAGCTENMTGAAKKTPFKPQCSDGIDNDGDGLIDFPHDPGCSSRTDNDESNCGDGVCTGDETADTCPQDCGLFCYTDADCFLNEACQANRCVPVHSPDCSFDYECGAGEVCLDGVCSPLIGDPVWCSFDYECGVDYVCLDGVCSPLIGDPCSFDYECASGYVCVDGVCVIPSPSVCMYDWECVADFVCVDGVCMIPSPSGCTYDYECGVGMICGSDRVCQYPPNAPPYVHNFVAEPSTGSAPLAVTFRWTVFDEQDVYTYILAYGDGKSSAVLYGTDADLMSHTYTYRAPGTYNAVLTVTDQEGAQTAKPLIVQVYRRNQ